MTNSAGSHYERAFECWLKDNGVQYLTVDQHKRSAFARGKIKSFDFLFYVSNTGGYIAEIKGRKCTSKSLTAFGSLPNWVTVDDIESIENWIEIFGQRYQGLFIFVYDLENIDVDTDGREIFEYNDKRYVFVVIKVDDYKKGQTIRSKKWRTISLPAEFFKERSFELKDLLYKDLGDEQKTG